MTEPFQNMAIGLIELALALAYFQRALPVMLARPRLHAVKIWLFAFSLGLLGAGRLESAIRVEHTPALLDMGHLSLILYAMLRLHLILRTGACKWWPKS